MNKDQLTIVGLAACLAVDTVVHFHNRKRIKTLVSNATDIAIYAVKTDKENDYLRDLLDKHEVPITEFDRIALDALWQD